jgi:RNA polymerase sigma-70 factor (sigma-E family)
MTTLTQTSGDHMARPHSDAEFTDFVHASWAPLYRTAYLMIGDRGLAEDLVQTALAKTYASWARVREVESAHAYARTTMVNTATSWFRRRGWRNEQPTERLPATSYEDDPAMRPTVMQALAQLPPRQRAVVVLRFYDDLSVTATAQALGCAEGTVKSQTSDALAALRTLLGESIIPHESGAIHD